MKSNWWFKFIFLLIVLVGSAMMVAPTAFDLKEESGFPVKSKINLGLDLQGGLYMILGIDFNKVYKDEAIGIGRKIIELLNDEGIKARLGELDESEITDPKQVVIVEDPTQTVTAKDRVKEYYPTGYVRLTREEDDQGILGYGVHKARKIQIEEESVTKSIEVIRNRIDEFGVTEPEITSQGNDRILIQLPGVKDIERAKKLIGQTAKLEFKMVNDEVAQPKLQEWVDKAKKAGIEYESNSGERFSDYLEKLNEHLAAELPDGFVLAFQKVVSKTTNEVTELTPFLVEKNGQITGEDLQDADVQIDQQKNEPYVAMNFKAKGARLFAKLTGENVGKRMAVVLDGNVTTAPSIREKISGGRSQITLGSGGNFAQLSKEAHDIALVLRAGALPVQLDFLEQRIVGAQLGADSIEDARYASLIGVVLVFFFIVFYYRMAGAIAIFTLGLNILFILACLVGLEATLTLPGIAGIALTVGMAIDASIIIYERIREEVRKGTSHYKSVEGGFEQAFWTIIDANITTALAGLCLLNFGTGPIRGFAVTLLIGIVATVYTSYFVGQMIFEFYMNKTSGKSLSI